MREREVGESVAVDVARDDAEAVGARSEALGERRGEAGGGVP